MRFTILRLSPQITRSSEALLIVDAVSALGADRLYMDAWGVDVVVSCSQKGLMTPPGLGLCAVGPRALERMLTARLPKYYWDLRRYLDSLEKDTTPFTPAVSLWYGLREALRAVRREGIEAVFARHARLAAATRVAVKELGLGLFPQHPANTLTAIRLPAEVDGKRLVRHLRGAVRDGLCGRAGPPSPDESSGSLI
ncbi:MAG: hypothetical protein KatS3mg115_1330 [Candidatus Poribacteria bacterium]|nr:MAG: hypothetical protein KatS3mg115_1330 [Candidatus Poribacteria bacterium]